MRGAVYNNKELAGFIEKDEYGNYIFSYEETYFNKKESPSISLTLPKNLQIYKSANLFAFFQGLLSEGVNKDIQCRLLKIDEKDDFTRLLQTTAEDTIGAITIKQVD